MIKKLTAAALVVVMVVSGCFVFVSNDSEAIGEDLSSTYGQATNINIGPGYRWTYTPEFPSDLTQYITVTLEVNDGDVASVSNGTVTVTISPDAVVGTVYNVVIRATMSSPVQQTAAQYVTFTIVSGLDVSGTLNDIIAGTNIDFTPVATSGMGDVTWTVTNGTTLPAGLSLSNGVVSGIPTSVGQNSINLMASAGGQTKNLVVDFIVYSAITSGDDETIYSNNKQVSSTPVENGQDIGVTWVITNGTLPAGFSFDSSTGVISGISDEYQESVITITGTSSSGPAQSITKTITVRSEPGLALVSPKKIYTYVGAEERDFAVSFNSNSSARTWVISDVEGVSISEGKITVGPMDTPGEYQLIITLRSAWGQMRAVTTTLVVEDILTISGDSSMSLLAGVESSTTAFTVTGGAVNELSVTTSDVGLDVRIEDGKLYASDNSPDKGLSATVAVTSAAGQIASKVVSIDVFSQLVFTSAPTGGAIIYAV